MSNKITEKQLLKLKDSPQTLFAGQEHHQLLIELLKFLLLLYLLFLVEHSEQVYRPRRLARCTGLSSVGTACEATPAANVIITVFNLLANFLLKMVVEIIEELFGVRVLVKCVYPLAAGPLIRSTSLRVSRLVPFAILSIRLWCLELRLLVRGILSNRILPFLSELLLRSIPTEDLTHALRCVPLLLLLGDGHLLSCLNKMEWVIVQ